METAEGAALPVDSSVARWTLIASILGSSMAFIDGSVVNVALPSIQADLGGGLATQQWVVDAYLLTLGSLILVGGSLGDIFGESKVFAIGVASFAGASLLCAIAPDAPSLIVFRAVQGMAGRASHPGLARHDHRHLQRHRARQRHRAVDVLDRHLVHPRADPRRLAGRRLELAAHLPASTCRSRPSRCSS